MMNGVDLVYLVVIVYIISKYRKQVKIAEGWKASAIEVNKLLNDLKHNAR